MFGIRNNRILQHTLKKRTDRLIFVLDIPKSKSTNLFLTEKAQKERQKGKTSAAHYKDAFEPPDGFFETGEAPKSSICEDAVYIK